MTPLLTFLIKSSISLALLYSLFRFLMRNERTHSLNRFLLLGILLGSALIPFLNVQFFYEEIPLKQIEVVREFVSAPIPDEAVLAESSQLFIPEKTFSVNLWLLVYVLVIAVLFIRLFIAIVKVSQIINKADKRRFRKIVLAVVKDVIQPFTFLNRVVLSEKDFKENKDIVVAHELAHIKQMHAVDLVVCELFAVMQFFNPFMWLLRRDLKLIHEYQADEAVLKKGIDAQKYQLLVLEKAVGERRFAMVNHFTQKPILKRLKMMKKTKLQKWGGVKLILFVPILIVLLQAFARPELITKSKDFIPVRYTGNKAEQWLSKWTIDNIGKGIFEPALTINDFPQAENNVFVILMNANDDYLVEGNMATKENLKAQTTRFLQGENPGDGKAPDFVETEVPYVGKINVPQCLVSYKNDINSSPEAVNYTLRQIGEAYLEAREAKAYILFGESYFDLNEKKQAAVNLAVPVRFVYEYPKSPPASVWLPFDRKPSPEPKPMQIVVKEDRSVYVQNQRFNTFEDFEKGFLQWNKELNESNKSHGNKAYYRAYVTFEDIPYPEQKPYMDAFHKLGLHVEHYNDKRKPQIRSFEVDKLKDRNEKVQTEAQMEVASNEKMDSVCKLFIPEGFSPNGDGIHDCFIVKGLFPDYPNAKLIIYNSEGQKLFEKENYGNSDVWGKDKAWWDGNIGEKSVKQKKLPAGNYDYMLELGNGEVKTGTVMLTSSAPPQVLEVLPAKPQYPIPSIRFHENWINLNGARYELNVLKNALEDLFPNDGTQRQVELTVYSTVSKERVEEIYAALQSVEDLEIIRKDVTPPPPPPLKPITLRKNGVINFAGKDYTFEEFEQNIITMEKQHRMVSDKNDLEEYRNRATVTIESGTDEANIVRFKKIMEKGNFADIHYKTEVQKKTENDSEFAKTENQKLNKVVVHLNQNKLNFQGKFCKVENINNEVQKYIEQNPDTKIVELVLHEPDELSKEITEKVKEELNKITGVEVKVKAVEVMLIKKSE